jgi:multidrug resistance protein, MATE family
MEPDSADFGGFREVWLLCLHHGTGWPCGALIKTCPCVPIIRRELYFPETVSSPDQVISTLPTRSELRALLTLATPIVVIQVGVMLMGVVDTLIIGHLSAEALAAVAIGNLYFFGAVILAQGVLHVLDPIVAQAVGANDQAAISRAVQRGVVLAVWLAVPISLLLLPAGLVFTAARQPADVVPLAAQYVVWMIPGTVPFFLFVVLRQTLQAMHLTRAIVWSIVVANLVNALLNWVLIFGHAGFPALGVGGSALATTTARWFMAVMLFILAWDQLRRYFVPFRRESLALGPIARMLGRGLPIGSQMLLEFGAFAAIALLMGRLGTVQVAGHQIAINLASLTFMVPLGVGAAAAVLVGNAVGRGDATAARRSARTALFCSTVFMSLTGILFLLGPQVLARLYTNDATVLAIAVGLIPIAGVFQVFDGLQAVGAGVLRGLGDTRAPMVINILGFWLFGMPVSIYLGFSAGLGPKGLWWGFVAGLGAVAILLLFRIRARLRRSLLRVAIDQDSAADPLTL